MYSAQYDLKSKVPLIGEIERLNLVNYELKVFNEKLLSELQSLRGKSPDTKRHHRAHSPADQHIKSDESEFITVQNNPVTSDQKKDDLIALKDAQIHALRKEIESLQLMKEIYDNIKLQNIILSGELQKKIKELDALKLESQQQEKDASMHTPETNKCRRPFDSAQKEGSFPQSGISTAPNTDAKNLESNQEKAALLKQINQLTRQVREAREASADYKLENQKLLTHIETIRLTLESKTTLIKTLEEELAYKRRQIEDNRLGIRDFSAQQTEEKAAFISELRSRISHMQNDYENRIKSVSDYWEIRFKEVLCRELEEQARKFQEIWAEHPKVKALNEKIIDYETKITLLGIEIERLNLELDKRVSRPERTSSVSNKELEEKIFLLVEANYKLGCKIESKEREAENLRSQLALKGNIPTQISPFKDPNPIGTPLKRSPQPQKESPKNELSPEKLSSKPPENIRSDVQGIYAQVQGPMEDKRVIDKLAAKIRDQNIKISALEDKIKYLEVMKELKSNA